MTTSPIEDFAIVEAFHRWLDHGTAMDEADDCEDETASDEEYWKALRALYETIETPATSLIGLAIQAYIVLSEGLSPGGADGHSASIRLKDEEEVGPLPARIAAGLYTSLCNINPDFARLAQAKRGARLRLDLTGRPPTSDLPT